MLFSMILFSVMLLSMLSAGEALALLLMMIGTVGYFVHNPYRKDRKKSPYPKTYHPGYEALLIKGMEIKRRIL